jgi:hypothetical protein
MSPADAEAVLDGRETARDREDEDRDRGKQEIVAHDSFPSRLHLHIAGEEGIPEPQFTFPRSRCL